jgi:putative redox protein
MIEVNVVHLGEVKFKINARQHALVSDQPTEAGGHDEGMTPPEFFLSALGSCAAYYAVAYLKKKGLGQEGVAVRVTAEKAGPPARLDNFHIDVRVPITLNEVDRQGLDRAVHHCLIHATLQHPPTVQIELHTPIAA